MHQRISYAFYTNDSNKLIFSVLNFYGFYVCGLGESISHCTTTLCGILQGSILVRSYTFSVQYVKILSYSFQHD